ncbi:hypothetical protein J7K93_05180 [bacterium]|nr:hypothetical protein [bacterium]
MQKSEILSALQPVVNALEKLSIPYYIGGSIASSVYGIARATMDIDIVADIKICHISLLKKELEELYYIDEEMVKEAVRNSSSFNLIHIETVFKIDVFIIKDMPYQQNALKRKIKDTFEGDDENSEFYFSSPEDIIINKLQWYELGNRVSERQWLDVTGVIKVQGDSLDKEYLKTWSKKLGLFELLKNAFKDTEIKL